jgi:hypothetical protein
VASYWGGGTFTVLNTLLSVYVLFYVAVMEEGNEMCTHNPSWCSSIALHLVHG